MKMKADPIIQMAKHLGGNVIFFTQGKDGNCGGWVARWIRKYVAGKSPWEGKYFDSMPSRLYGGFFMKEATKAGNEKAADLMNLQATEKQKAADADLGIGYVEKAIELANAKVKLMVMTEDAEGKAEWQAKVAYWKDLKLRMSNSKTYPKSEGWMRDYITKETKAGAQLAEYVRLDGDFTKGKIGKDAEGLKKLHAGCDGAIVYVALKKTGDTGHAVGLCRLSKDGMTIFFDPNVGAFHLKWDVFDKWVACYWQNSEYLYETYKGKVFRALYHPDRVGRTGTYTPAKATPATPAPPATPATVRPKFAAVFGNKFPTTQ
jgi:hypothetical protein